MNLASALRLGAAALLVAGFGCRPTRPVIADLHAAAATRGAAGFQDTGDGGDDPWVAGCHWEFSDRNCTRGKKFMQGDYCKDAAHLVEWTDTTCHTLTDSVKHDCNAECRNKGHKAGSCVAVKNACGEGLDSARCECVDE
jgi:hypothetical protein